MNEEVITIQEIVAILRKRALLVLLTIVVCEALALGLAHVMPKKYKSSALLNLQATYFEVPLLGDSIVGSRDASEMHAQKEALIRLALSDSFMDTEGEKFSYFKSTPNSSNRVEERQGLRKNIDYFSSSTTTFQITAIGNSPLMAFGLASDTLDQIVSTLVNERQKNVMNYRDSLRKQLEALGVATTTSSAGNSVLQAKEQSDQLAGLKERLRSLRTQYTANHPTVLAMKEKIKAFEKQMNSRPEEESAPSDPSGPLTIDSTQKGRRTEFGEELLKKINYLDIGLEIERNKKDLPYLEILERPFVPNAYFAPKVSAFGIGGILAGILLAALEVMFLEYIRVTKITPDFASRELGIPLLGSLPVMTPPERS
jgi:Chain length determinant protein